MWSDSFKTWMLRSSLVNVKTIFKQKCKRWIALRALNARRRIEKQTKKAAGTFTFRFNTKMFYDVWLSNIVILLNSMAQKVINWHLVNGQLKHQSIITIYNVFHYWIQVINWHLSSVYHSINPVNVYLKALSVFVTISIN